MNRADRISRAEDRVREIRSRQLEVLRMIADGYVTGEIAARLYISERTVKMTLHDFGVRNGLVTRSQMVAFALRNGMIS